MDRNPNIILILADDMGYGDFSLFNDGQSSTPNLDALIGDGRLFSQHYAASPVCAPSRAGLLTGRYPHRTGVVDTIGTRGTDRLGLSETTLADVMSSRGYRTGLVGKWHSGAIGDRYHPERRGFDEFNGFRGGWQDYWEWRIERGGQPKSADGRYLTNVFTAEAIDFVRRNRDVPFFLHLAYNAPHYPFQAPESTIERFRRDGRSETVATIYAMIAELDAGVGALIDEVDRLGIGDDTLILFSSDNGPQLDGTGDDSTVRYNYGLAGQKQLVLDGGIRLPLIARWPGRIATGTESASFIHAMDIFPTVMDLIGYRPETELALDGCGQLSALLDGADAMDAERYWQWTRYMPMARSNAAMRSGSWKLVYPAIQSTLDWTEDDRAIDERFTADPTSFTDVDNQPLPEYEHLETGAPMLFDITADPGETKDLAGEHPQTVARMSSRLAAWFEDVETERKSIDD